MNKVAISCAIGVGAGLALVGAYVGAPLMTALTKSKMTLGKPPKRLDNLGEDD
jgi:hypothetical protein